MHWETKKILLAHFIAIFALLWWSRTKPTSPRLPVFPIYAPYDLIPKLKKHNQKSEDQHPLRIQSKIPQPNTHTHTHTCSNSFKCPNVRPSELCEVLCENKSSLTQSSTCKPLETGSAFLSWDLERHVSLFSFSPRP